MSKSSKKYFMIDLDGTIYHRSTALPFAKEFIALLKEKNFPYLFFTNSPEFSKAELARKLNGMGIECMENDFLSAGDVAIEYLLGNLQKKIAETRIFVLGSKSLKTMFQEKGFTLVEKVEEKADFVMIGYDREITLKDCEDACTHIFNGASPILANRDSSIPTERGLVPHTGAISALIEFTTKIQPLDMGKPGEYTLKAVLEKLSCSKDDLYLVGDNLETDIALGENFQISSYLLMTGLTTKEMLETYQHGDFLQIFDNLEDLCRSL